MHPSQNYGSFTYFSIQLPSAETTTVTVFNIEDVASFITSNYTGNETTMLFGPGKEDNEVILEVPIIPLGQGRPMSVIKVTAMMHNVKPTQGIDHDPKFGISDGSATNVFWVSDTSNYDRYPPCDGANAVNAVSGPSILSENYPSTINFYFMPYKRFGMCSVEHVAFVNVAVFENELDLSKKIYFQVKRHQAHEEYAFYMLRVQVFDHW